MAKIPALRQAALLHFIEAMLLFALLFHFRLGLLTNFVAVLFVLAAPLSAMASLESDLDSDCPKAPKAQVSKAAVKLQKNSSAIVQNLEVETAPVGLQVPDFRTLWQGGSQCSKFITGKSELGSAGAQVELLISQKSTPGLMKGSSDIQMICPNFSNWTDSNKKAFYVWAFASIAYKESSCGNDEAPHAGMGGEIARGLYQLSFNKEDMKTCSQACNDGDSVNDKSSTRCAVSMLECYSTSRNKFFNDDGYWQPLKSTAEGLQTCQRMAKFPGCDPTACGQAIGYGTRTASKN